MAKDNKKLAAKKPEPSDSESSSSEEAPVKVVEKKRKLEKGKAAAKVADKTTKKEKPTKKPAPKPESSDESSAEEEEAKPVANEEASSDASSSEEENGAKPDSDGEDAEKADSDAEEEAAEEQPPAKKNKFEASNGSEVYEVFVERCPESITDEDVQNLFKDCGSVVGIKWLSGKDGGFTGRGFVKLDSEDAVTSALKLDGAEVAGAAISVQLPRSKSGGQPAGGQPGVSNTVFLGRLSDDVQEDDIRSLFADCGEITAIRWGTKEGAFAGYGFCEFADPSSVEKAVALSGTEVAGRPISLDVAAPRGGGGDRGGRGGGRGGRGGGRGGGFGGGRGGGGFGGGRGGGGFGGRGGGGRGGGGFGGRGGRGAGFGGRGGGGPRGKRTTF